MPPAKPTRLKVLQGETRPSRLRNEPQPAERPPEPPGWLNPEALEVWDRLVRDLDAMGLLFSADTETIAAFASSAALLAEAERALAREGYMAENQEGRRHRNPWLIVRRDAMDGISRFGSVLGFTPLARVHLAAAAKQPDEEHGGELLTA